MRELIDLIAKNSMHESEKEKRYFLQDIDLGLSKPYKQIPSKYFYDEQGSLLFNKITRHPDYYLTNCETEILNRARIDFVNLLLKDEFNLIELGPGEGIKTQLLLQTFLQNQLEFNYVPIDISIKYLQSLNGYFENKFPNLKVTAIHTEYLHGLKWIANQSNKRNFILFLGSSIGNYNIETARRFLFELWQSINNGDYVLIGFDLRKDIRILMRAYDDDHGITREFNLNLLKRINRELDADFDLYKFYHYATYNAYSGAMESYLISMIDQVVHVGAANKKFEFKSYEPIHVEYSYKYLMSQVNELAASVGFKILHNFTDSKEYFVDSLWQAVKA